MGFVRLGEFLGAASPRIDIVDVGAMHVGGREDPYMMLVRHGNGHVVGFEPIETECEKLNKGAGKRQRYLPYFIGDGGTAEFKLCSNPMTSSLLEPNLPLLRRFHELADMTTPVSRTQVQTRRLDDIPEITGMDLLKLDVQGMELAILRASEMRLRDCVVVQTEVEFAPMYVGQPLFADIDIEMRRQGFALHVMGECMGRCFKPIINQTPGHRLNQVLWTEVVYVKDYTRLGELTAEQLLKLAIIVNDCYGSCDLAALALQHYDAKAGKSLWKPFMQRLTGSVPPAPPLE